MRTIISISLLFALLNSLSVFAQTTSNSFDTQAQTLLDAHYKKYKNLEYFSGGELSVYIPGHDIQNYYVGQVSHDENSSKINADSLFEIGSITKSYTAAVALQLEKENKLNLSNTLKDQLPQYAKWSSVTLRQLLNMSSGLPNYTDSPIMLAEETADLQHVWKNEEAIQFVYPPNDLAPPLKIGYFYTNTGYILMALITEKLTHNTFQTELTNRTIKSAGLKNTFYPTPEIDEAVKTRRVASYSFNQYDAPMLVGKSVDGDLSWAGAAGAVVSNSEDIIKWVNALFVGNKVLDTYQKQKLTQIISTTTGNPIEKTTAKDSHGFGLGVAQAFDQDDLGRYWFYEGETLGFRALYMYLPCNGVVISAIFNSATNTENDHIHLLIKDIYKLIVSTNPQLKCKIS